MIIWSNYTSTELLKMEIQNERISEVNRWERDDSIITGVVATVTSDTNIWNKYFTKQKFCNMLWWHWGVSVVSGQIEEVHVPEKSEYGEEKWGSSSEWQHVWDFTLGEIGRHCRILSRGGTCSELNCVILTPIFFIKQRGTKTEAEWTVRWALL